MKLKYWVPADLICNNFTILFQYTLNKYNKIYKILFFSNRPFGVTVHRSEKLKQSNRSKYRDWIDITTFSRLPS